MLRDGPVPRVELAGARLLRLPRPLHIRPLLHSRSEDRSFIGFHHTTPAVTSYDPERSSQQVGFETLWRVAVSTLHYLRFIRKCKTHLRLEAISVVIFVGCQQARNFVI